MPQVSVCFGGGGSEGKKNLFLDYLQTPLKRREGGRPQLVCVCMCRQEEDWEKVAAL